MDWYKLKEAHKNRTATITKIDKEFGEISISSNFTEGMRLEFYARLKWYQRIIVWFYDRYV